MSIHLQVLLVEDNDDDAQLLLRELRRGGYEPHCIRVDTPEAMKERLIEGRWDIVIADHNMPRFSSIDALKMLKDSGLDVPFIIVSGSIGEEIAVAAMKAGAHDYILKGQLARLLPAIDRELRDANVRRARRQAEAMLQYQANHDALTGLFNRREFEQRLARALESARLEGRQHAVGYMDLDQFKIVNDTCGHVAGDELLKQLAVLLKEKVRENDILARLGGDEFGLLLENCGLEQAQRIANAMLNTVRGFRFSWLDKTFEIGASIGLVTLDRNSDNPGQVLSAADLACYAAKDLGRNRVHVYQTGDAELARRHGEMHWAAHISKALSQDRFRLYRQTILPLKADKRGEHFEVLVRLLDDQGQLVAPGAFIPAAERFNLMPAVDRWVVRHTLAYLRRRCDASDPAPPITCAVNLSGTTLNDEGFLGFVLDELPRSRVPPHSLCFEITETAAVANLARAVQFMKELKVLGCRFSLDDFGSGLSSFAYLKNLPVDFLKIDGSFIRDIVDDPIDFAMTEAINKIGQVMGLQTIAEFVENEAILERVRGLGMDYAQGYGIAEPEPLERPAADGG